MDIRNLAELYDLEALDWQMVTDRLDAGFTQAPGTGGPDRHTCWLATIDADGRPHVTGIGALRCTLTLALHDLDLVVDGEAHLVTDPAVVAESPRSGPRSGRARSTRAASRSPLPSAPLRPDRRRGTCTGSTRAGPPRCRRSHPAERPAGPSPRPKERRRRGWW